MVAIRVELSLQAPSSETGRDRSRPVGAWVRRRRLPMGAGAAGGHSISYWMKTVMESSTWPGWTGVLAISALAAPMAMVSPW